MWLLLLLPWLFLLSNASIETPLRIATARALKLKCESLPYRSYFEGNTCYFAIQAEVKHGDESCAIALAGAKMRVDRERQRVLGILYLNPATYHDILSAGQMKNMFCSLEISYTCEQGEASLPGKCVIRNEKSVTWTEASNFCSGKGANSIILHNEYENEVIAGVLVKNEAGWLLPSRGNIWSAEGQTIDYWKWSFEGRTPSDLKCTDGPQHAIISKNGKTDCSAYGIWKVDNSTNKNIALCVKEAECPLCPIATTPRVSGPPKQTDQWDLKYFYNWGRKLHAFCATPEGCKIIQDNGIKYCENKGFGSLGGTLSDEGYKRLNEVCSNPEDRKKIVKMWFTKKGSSYHHIFEDSTEPKHVYVGYVSLKGGACGSRLPVKKWSCQVSDDMMYAGDLDSPNLHNAEWYTDREQDGGRVHFWLWEKNENWGDNRADVVKPAVYKFSSCPENGVWSEWTETGQCPAKSGACHNTTRKRTCTTKCGNCPCSGPAEDVGPCGIKPSYTTKTGCCPPYQLFHNANTHLSFCGIKHILKTVCPLDLCLAYTFHQDKCSLLAETIPNFDAVCPIFYQEWVKRHDRNCPDVFKKPDLDYGYIPNPALSKGATPVGFDFSLYVNEGFCIGESIMDTIRPNNSHAIQGGFYSVIEWDGKIGSWSFIKRMERRIPKIIPFYISHYIRAARCFKIDQKILFSDTRSCGGMLPEIQLGRVPTREGPVRKYGVTRHCPHHIKWNNDYYVRPDVVANDYEYPYMVRSAGSTYVTCIDGAWIIFTGNFGTKVTNATCFVR